MSIYEGMTIEQDPKNDQRFRITIPELAMDRDRLEPTIADNGVFYYVESVERQVRAVKRAIKEAAASKLVATPAYQWVLNHGGRSAVCRIAMKSKGDNIRCYTAQPGQPRPSYLNEHWRAGLSITFKERDKAMLFKMMFVGVDRQEAVAA